MRGGIITVHPWYGTIRPKLAVRDGSAFHVSYYINNEPILGLGGASIFSSMNQPVPMLYQHGASVGTEIGIANHFECIW